MLLKELRLEIKFALDSYERRYNTPSNVPEQRKENIKFIRKVIHEEDPIKICKEIKYYLASISLPFISFLPFIDINLFVFLISTVIEQEKYSEINLLRTLVSQKEQLISNLQNQVRLGLDKVTINEVENLTAEIKLLKCENNFLYSTLVNLDRKISLVEQESKQNLERALRSEKKCSDMNKIFIHLQSDPSKKTNMPSLRDASATHIEYCSDQPLVLTTHS